MLPLKNTSERFGWIALLLHWVMAIMIIGMLCLGLYMAGLRLSMEKLKLIGWHKEIGACVLGLVAIRLIWRLVNIIPPLPESMPMWQRLAAHASHYALYGFMFTMPVSGWLMSSAAGFPVSVFGWFTLPNLINQNEEARKLFLSIHTWLSYALIATIAAHIAAALYHHFITKDNILRRMLP